VLPYNYTTPSFSDSQNGVPRGFQYKNDCVENYSSHIKKSVLNIALLSATGYILLLIKT